MTDVFWQNVPLDFGVGGVLKSHANGNAWLFASAGSASGVEFKRSEERVRSKTEQGGNAVDEQNDTGTDVCGDGLLCGRRLPSGEIRRICPPGPDAALAKAAKAYKPHELLDERNFAQSLFGTCPFQFLVASDKLDQAKKSFKVSVSEKHSPLSDLAKRAADPAIKAASLAVLAKVIS